MQNIRNFCIIAHIDHGKSTLADRILELTGAVSKRELKEQMLDSMDIERERGITIKLNTVHLNYKGYEFNLIDTPGHVDFSYEVSRSLAACDGAILVVDATQGIEAQTLANLYLALNHNLTIIPVINKIDLPNADVPKVTAELVKVLGFKEDEIIPVSGKTGENVNLLLDAVIDRINPPQDLKEGTKALIFDSYFDQYKGVVAYICVKSGSIKTGDTIIMMNNNEEYVVTEVGVNTPSEKLLPELKAGDVGWVAGAIKSVESVRVGDTITTKRDRTTKPLEGYKKVKSMVYSGIYPIEPNKYNHLKEALEKLKLNDASLTFDVETSEALGFGFRCGFLGLLHMEIIEERIKREFGIDIIATSPSVIYKVELTNGNVIEVDNPSKMPNKVNISSISEPFVKASIFVPSEYIGSIMELCQEKRGIYKTTEYIDEKRVNIIYELPLAEIVYDFFDKLKSYTKGYASFDYELSEYKVSDLVKMDILINGEVVDALSVIVHKDAAYHRGLAITKALKELIPRQLFEVPIQASIGSKVIARENIAQMRKNVLAKCYGGDISRKRK
ncbi:MAG: translation elongation factor 4, partial [Bacteroides xylanisolvens]|nr:translation elongation factor 4 [Bacteroides xylanisolvens]